MNPRTPRTLIALALGLAVAGTAARDAKANPISFGTTGSVDVPTGGVANLVYFNGNPAGSFDPDTPGQINLGSFVVSPLSLRPNTPDVTFSKDPFQILVYSGTQAAGRVTGYLDGQIGPAVAKPALTATFTGVEAYTNTPLPFDIKLPTSPVPLAVSDGTSAAATTLMVPAAVAPVPEPASVAVFGLALGGLGLWHRRRSGR